MWTDGLQLVLIPIYQLDFSQEKPTDVDCGKYQGDTSETRLRQGLPLSLALTFGPAFALVARLVADAVRPTAMTGSWLAT